MNDTNLTILYKDIAVGTELSRIATCKRCGCPHSTHKRGYCPLLLPAKQ